MPLWAHSLTTRSITGVSTSGSSSFGTVRLNGKKRVPRPPATTTAVLTFITAASGRVRSRLPSPRPPAASAHGCHHRGLRPRPLTAAITAASGRVRSRLRSPLLGGYRERHERGGTRRKAGHREERGLAVGRAVDV